MRGKSLCRAQSVEELQNTKPEEYDSHTQPEKHDPVTGHQGGHFPVHFIEQPLESDSRIPAKIGVEDRLAAALREGRHSEREDRQARPMVLLRKYDGRGEMRSDSDERG